MSWIIAGVAAMGVLQGAANQKKMERQNQYRAEAIRYSPWTGMGDPGVQELPGAFELGLKGAATGAMASNAFGGGGGGAATQGAQTTSMNSATPELYNPYMMMQA